MKKISIVLSVVIMVSLLLAACGADNTLNGTPGVGNTPDTGVIPNTGLTATPELGVMDTTPTLMTTDPLVNTATVEAPLATNTAEVVATPAVDLNEQPDRLSALLGYDVVNQSGVEIGEVQGVVVSRSAPLSKNVTEGDSTTMSSAQGAAQIAYVVVEVNELFNDGAAAGNLATTPAVGTTALPDTTATVTGLAGDDDAMTAGTLMFGDEVLLPLSAFEPLMVGVPATDLGDRTDPALMLTVDEQVVATAPRFDRDLIDLSVSRWDVDFDSYWTGQGLTIPVTGADATTDGNLVLFEDGFAQINAVNANDDDLGEVEDFIIDPATGEFRYAILAAGGFLGIGERHIPVPMSMVHWVLGDEDMADRVLTDIGHVQINVPEGSLETAPAFDALDAMDTTLDGWDTDIQSFWQTLDTNITK